MSWKPLRKNKLSKWDKQKACYSKSDCRGAWCTAPSFYMILFIQWWSTAKQTPVLFLSFFFSLWENTAAPKSWIKEINVCLLWADGLKGQSYSPSQSGQQQDTKTWQHSVITLFSAWMSPCRGSFTALTCFYASSCGRFSAVFMCACVLKVFLRSSTYMAFSPGWISVLISASFATWVDIISSVFCSISPSFSSTASSQYPGDFLCLLF